VFEGGLSDLSAERASLATLRYSENSAESSLRFPPVSGSKLSSTALTTSRFIFKHRERVVKTHLTDFRGERSHRKYCYKYNRSTVHPPVEMGDLR